MNWTVNRLLGLSAAVLAHLERVSRRSIGDPIQGDNDGRLDVYFCRRGPNQLWRQTADGRSQPVWRLGKGPLRADG